MVVELEDDNLEVPLYEYLSIQQGLCSYVFCAIATKFYYDTKKMDRTAILFKAFPNA
jgi:hypothetical protein